MAKPRRKCKLADSNHKNVDIRRFEKLIIDTVNKTVPNKNPKVFKEYFSTDLLTQSESVLLGRALAKIDELKAYGKTVTIFRLFDGKMYSSEDATKPIKKRRK
jgi:hypothetical protein